MIVYHGSNQEVRRPDVRHSRKKVDFGAGFYVTPLFEQAKSWSSRYKRRGQAAVISCYELDETVFDQTRVKRFDAYSEEWLDFIVQCRTGVIADSYDLVMGGVANDKVFDTLELFFSGLIDKKTALGRLIYEKPNYQSCLRTQDIIDRYLHYQGSERI